MILRDSLLQLVSGFSACLQCHIWIVFSTIKLFLCVLFHSERKVPIVLLLHVFLHRVAVNSIYITERTLNMVRCTLIIPSNKLYACVLKNISLDSNRSLQKVHLKILLGTVLSKDTLDASS